MIGPGPSLEQILFKPGSVLGAPKLIGHFQFFGAYLAWSALGAQALGLQADQVVIRFETSTPVLGRRDGASSCGLEIPVRRI